MTTLRVNLPVCTVPVCTRCIVCKKAIIPGLIRVFVLGKGMRHAGCKS